MVRGLLSGGIWSLVLGGIGVVTASMLTTLPAGNKPPEAPQLDVPVTEAEPAPSRETAALDLVDDQPSSGEPPRIVDAKNSTPNLVSETQPPVVPETSIVDEALTVPNTTSVDGLGLSEIAPVLPNPQAVAPQVPTADVDAELQTDTASVPRQPEIESSEKDQPIPNEASEEPQVEVATRQELDTPKTASVVETIEVSPVESPENASVLESEVSENSEGELGLLPIEPDETPAIEPSPLEDGSPVVKPDTPTLVPPAADSDASEAIAAPVVVSIVDEPTATMPGSDSGIRVNRIGQTNTVEEATLEKVDKGDNHSALERFAGTYENPEKKPEVAIVLLDRGEMPSGADALSRLPFPVTVVLSPTEPDAAEKMRAYREIGLEVAVMAELPAGASPSDVEVSFSGAFEVLPETIALVDVDQFGLQSKRGVVQQAMEALSADGRGFLTISRGLNTALRAADEAGVPSATIYRDLDSEWQDARVIRRFLDQAAFRARQESGVVLFGRLRANTVSALLLWGNASRAQQVSLAPLSIILANDAP